MVDGSDPSPTGDGTTKLTCVGQYLIYQDENGDVNTIDIASKMPSDVVTTLSFNYATKTLSFVNEEGNSDNIDLTPCFPESSYDGVLHEVVLDGVSYPLSVGELTIDYNTKLLTYVNAAGDPDVIDLSPCIPELPDFPQLIYQNATHTVSLGNESWQLNCGALSFDATSCSLRYVNEKNATTVIPLPQDSHVYDAAACTLSIAQAKGGSITIPLGSPSDQVGLRAVDPCTLEFTYKNQSSQVALANSLVGCEYDPGTNELKFVWCDGTEKTAAFTRASLLCSTMADGTQVITFDDGGGSTKMFNIPAVNIGIDRDSFTLVGSTLTFTSDNDTPFSFDVCDVVANNCNATFTGINADGSWSFTDNAGNTFNNPAFPDVPIRSVCCIGPEGVEIDLPADAAGKITIPFHRTGVISPDDSVGVFWNVDLGQYELTVPAGSNTWGEPELALAGGFDFYGTPYSPGDHLFVTPSGSVICVPDKVEDTNSDTWGEPQVATGSGFDFFGVGYSPGDHLFVTPTGNVVCVPDKVVNTDTNTHTTVTSADGSVSVVTGTNAAGAPEFDLSVDHPGFLDKDGDPIPDGATLLQPDSFTPSATAPPSNARLLAFDASGNCFAYLPPEGVAFNDKDGAPLPTGASLLQITDFAASGITVPPTAQLLGLDANGNCVTYAPPTEGDPLPTFLNKQGDALVGGESLLQLSDFADAAVTLPPTSKILAVAADGSCALYSPPAGVSVPGYVGKDGMAIADGAVLMQLTDFPDAAVAMPATAKVLAVDANGDCMRYELPTGNSVDTNDWGVPSSASSPGTDFYGNIYNANDNLFTTPDGDVICIPDKITIPEIPVVPDYLDKNGDVIVTGTTLMQLADFPDADVPLPVDAKILALDANNDCMLFNTPNGVASGFSSTLTFADAAETGAGALITYMDSDGNTLEFCNGGKSYEQQLEVYLLHPDVDGCVPVAHGEVVPYGALSILPGGNCYGPCGPPPNGDIFNFDPADGGRIRVLRPGIYNVEHYMQTHSNTVIEELKPKLRINGVGPSTGKFGLAYPSPTADTFCIQASSCVCVTAEDILAGPDGTYATLEVVVFFTPNDVDAFIGLVGQPEAQSSVVGTSFAICGKVFECDEEQ